MSRLQYCGENHNKKRKEHDKQRHVKDLEQQIIKVSLEIMIEEEKVKIIIGSY